MSEIKGSINYTLTIDPTGQQHGLSYDNKLENDIVGLMVASQVLTVQLGQWKEYKKKEGIDKKKVGSNIALIAGALRSIRPIMLALLDSYDDYVAHQEDMSSKETEILKQPGLIPNELGSNPNHVDV